MGYTIQINPDAPAFMMGWQVAEALDEFAEDFAMRYCFIEPQHAEALEALLTNVELERQDAQIINRILARLRRKETVELLIG